MEAGTIIHTILRSTSAENAFTNFGIPGLVIFSCLALVIYHKKVKEVLSLVSRKPFLTVYVLPEAKDRTNDDLSDLIPLDFPSTTKLELCVYNSHKTESATNVNIDIQNLSRPSMQSEKIGDVGKMMNRRVNGFTFKLNHPLPPQARVPFVKISFPIPEAAFREKSLELVYSVFGHNIQTLEKKKLKNTIRVFHKKS